MVYYNAKDDVLAVLENKSLLRVYEDMNVFRVLTKDWTLIGKI